MAHVPMDRVILHRWLKSGYMKKGSFYKTEEGTPQGGIISPVLANLALDVWSGVYGSDTWNAAQACGGANLLAFT